VIAASLLVIVAPARAQESWDAVFLKGHKIGHVHTFVEKVSERGRELYRVRVDWVLKIRRLEDSVTMQLMYGTIETADGEVLRLDTRTVASNSEIRVHGDVVKGKMKLIMEVEGNQQRQEITIPWGKDIRGPYAAEQSMARKPMEQAETRVIKTYVPDVNRVVDYTFKAGPISEIPLGDGSTRPLRRVDQTAMLDGKARPELAATLWVDSSGQVLKLETDLMGGMVMYRTTKEGATSPDPRGGPRYDEIRNTMIAVNKVIPDPRRTTYVQYRLTIKDEDAAQIFPVDRRQTAQPGADKTSLIMNVQIAGPSDGAPAEAPADAQFLRPNAMVTSGDERIVSLARRAIGNAAEPWDKAVRINHWVFQNIRTKSFDVAFAPASEVALDLRGDCSEHAVLATAMSRAVGIPARIAVGLLYVDNEREKLKGFGYHVWHEVFVNNRWVALDSSWDQTSVDATHIKLADTSLEGVAPFEAFLPIARVQGKLEIDPIELR
jgi:transglutaminase/protease-like cytokinesis protein 3